jgi:hypothetical protein
MSDQNFAIIIGSIKENVPFYMGKVVNKITNILVYSKSSPPLITYTWSSDNNLIGTNGAIFTATYDYDATLKFINLNLNYIYDTINKQYIYVSTGETFSSKPDSKNKLLVKSRSGVYWSYPNIYLANILYNITNDPLGTSIIDIYFIPFDIYFKLDGKCASNKNLDMQSSIIWKDPEDFTVSDFYWSNIDDCNTGVKYEYCNTGKLCGNNNCRGACFSNDSSTSPDSLWYDCNYNANEKIFKCVENEKSKDFFDKSKLSVGIIILIVVGVLILLIGISLVVYFTIKKRRKKKTDDSDIDLLLASAAYPSAAYPSAAYPSAAYPSAAYPSDAYPSAAYPSAAYPSAAYPSAAYPSAAYPSAAYPSAAYPSDAYPSAAYPSAAYPSAAYPSV